MALLRYRIGRTVVDGEHRYCVTDNGPAQVADDGTATYADVGAEVIQTEPLTPDGKAACQFAVLQGNAAEKAARQGSAQPVATNDPAEAATLGTADTSAAPAAPSN